MASNSKMHKIMSVALSVAVASGMGICAIQPAHAAAGDTIASYPKIDVDDRERIEAMFNQLNAYRVSMGVPALKFNATLSSYTEDWSDVQANSNMMAHSTAYHSDSNMANRWSAYGENVAMNAGNPTVTNFMTQWKNSPGHNANMLNSTFTHVGLGIQLINSGTKGFATQQFMTFQPGMEPGGTYANIEDFFNGLPSDNETVGDAAITATAPTFDSANGVFTIPAKTGVLYDIGGGVEIKPGTYNANGQYITVNATAKPGYTLTGTKRWTYDFKSNKTKLIAEDPRVDFTNDTVSIPQVWGIDYSINGSKVQPGTYTIPGSVAITATLSAGANYELVGTKSWSYNLAGASPEVVAPADPSFDIDDRTYTIPSSSAVDYYANGVKVTSGTHFEPSTSVSIVAQAKDGYVIASKANSAWTGVYGSADSGNTVSVTATAPEFNREEGAYTIYDTPGIAYYANGLFVTGGTYSVETDIVNIRAVPLAGYAISGTSQWSESFVKFSGSLANPNIKNQEGSFSTLTTASVDKWFVNGLEFPSGTVQTTGWRTINITVQEKSNYTINGTREWSHTYTNIGNDYTAQEPVFLNDDAQYTLPDDPNVEYYVNGVKKAAGTHNAPPSGGEYTIVAKGIGGNLLVGTYLWTGVVPLVAETIAPTLNTNAGTYTIPNVKGAEYFVGGVKKSAGTHKFFGNLVEVVAEPLDGYLLSGDTSWSLASPNAFVAAPVPTADPGAGTYILPEVEGVSYIVNGENKPAGIYNAVGSETVSILPNEGYAFHPGALTQYTFSGIVSVTASAPKVDTVVGTIQIPSTEGVSYRINGVEKQAGTHSFTGTATVTAVAKVGYELSGTTTWAYTAVKAVAPTKPSWRAGSYTIPNIAGVTYKVNGTTKSAGTHAFKGSAKITAHAKSGYRLAGTSSWTIETRKVVATKKPSVSTSRWTYTVPKVTGVTYKANGKTVTSGKTYSHKGAVKFTAHAKSSSYLLSGTKSWSLDTRRAVTPTKPSVNTRKNTYTIPKKTGVTYKLNGKTHKSGTFRYMGKGSFKVTAHAKSGYRTKGTKSWTVKYS